MNSVNLIGRTVAAPNIRYVGQTNRPVAEFTLAVDDPYNRNPDGSFKAFFFYITIWGNKAEIAHSHIVKGQRIGITGRLTQEQFTPKDSDKPVTKTRIVAESFTLLEKPQGYQSRDSSYPPKDNNPAPQPAADNDPQDEIPF